MSPRQITILYAVGGLVMLGALAALWEVERRQLRHIEDDVEAFQAQVGARQDEIDAHPARAARAKELERALAGRRAVVAGKLDPEAVYDRLVTLRRELGLTELVVTAARDRQLGLWPEGSAAPFAPPSHAFATPWTRYVGVAGRYGQILRLLNSIESWDALVLVRDLVVLRAAEPALGRVPLRAGFSITLYEGAPSPQAAPVPTAAERLAVLGAPHVLARAVDDDWAAHGVDWRDAPAGTLPARNPFDPYPALTPAKPSRPAPFDADVLARALDGLERAAKSSGEGFDAQATELRRALGDAPTDPARLASWKVLDARLADVERSVREARDALAAIDRDLVALEALAGDGAQRTDTLAKLAAVEQAASALGSAPLAAERALVTTRIAALRTALGRLAPDEAVLAPARAALKSATDAGARGDLAGLVKSAETVAELGRKHPGSVIGALAREAADLQGRARKLEALAAQVRFTGITEQAGVRQAVVGGRRYRVGEKIDVDGESLDVVEIADRQLGLGWRGLRANRAR